MGSKPAPLSLRMKLPLREDAMDGIVGDGGEADNAGVAAPDDTAERPELAGVEGGGKGPEGESVKVDHGRVLSGERKCLWLS